MRLPETDELAGELYLVPPARFVAARDELVRKARAAGNRALAGELQSLRRPTMSAWLVNLLVRHEREALDRLFAVGRELRQAQTRLEAAKLRPLSTERQRLLSDLLDRARRQALDAGVQPSDAVLAEVSSTLQAALVDMSGSFTVLAGRLVRPMSHSGFGPMPKVGAPPPPVSELPPVESGTESPEWGVAPGARFRVVEPVPEQEPRTEQAPAAGGAHDVHRAEAALLSAESAHWQAEHDLADAEAALEAARDRLEWLDHQRMEARREKVTAEQHLAEARAAQRAAVHEVAEARRALEAAKSQPPSAPNSQ